MRQECEKLDLHKHSRNMKIPPFTELPQLPKQIKHENSLVKQGNQIPRTHARARVLLQKRKPIKKKKNRQIAARRRNKLFMLPRSAQLKLDYSFSFRRHGKTTLYIRRGFQLCKFQRYHYTLHSCAQATK